MKKIIYSMAVLMMGLAFTACSSDDDNNSDNNVSEKEQAMQAITSQYVNNVIFPIYQSLASQTSTLFDQLVEAKSKFRTGTLTQGDIDKLCNTFIAARSAWEQSESFLYGAATDFGIDPHIDTWPLDRTALAKALSSAEIIEDLDDLDDGGIDNARALVGEQQLGFHGIEFIIFRDGKNRSLAALQGVEDDEAFEGRNITGEQELVFAAAVAGDLRDKCFQLEVSWLGDKAPTLPGNQPDDVRKPYNKEEQQMLTRLRAIIDEHLADPDFNIELLATSMNMSHSALYKRLKALTGMSLVEFINDYKIFNAVQLFRQGETSVEQVCEQCGFGDAKNFRSMFKRKMQMTPKQYIQSL